MTYTDSIPYKEGKIYFASDFHFGVPDHASSLEREKLLIAWLEAVRADATAIYLMGDVFDFWFEYKTVIPKGFVRLLGKLAELTDSGIPVHLFKGNHDVWAFDYLQKEAGVQLHREPEITVLNGKKFYLYHGDGYGPGDYGYKFLKKVFANPVNQWLFKWLHPDIGTRLGLYFSHRSRLAHVARDRRKEKSDHPEDERLVVYCREFLKQNPDIEYFILGHRHLPVDLSLSQTTRCIILGDWITNFSYAVFDGTDVCLKFFEAIRELND
ncbi:MAG: UDP-2,3-diacylglucosamine diphosphatase [Bacteroidetes bacterium]|nr:UDP-2,3-diacylglucosamine diphosphatase [Bacteroidota bacterium]